MLIRQILIGLPAKAASSAPWVTYTEPELAQVGLTEAEARAAHGNRVTILRADFGGNDRAIAERKGKGLVKVMVVKGRPVVFAGRERRRPNKSATSQSAADACGLPRVLERPHPLFKPRASAVGL